MPPGSQPTPPTPPASPQALYPIFRKPGNIWTTPLPANAPLDPDSAGIVARIARQVGYEKQVPRLSKNPVDWHAFVLDDWQRIWPNIPADTPTRRVLWIDEGGQPVDPESQMQGFPLQSWIDAVPVPQLPLEQLRAEGGGDQPVVLYQQSTDTVWEFWILDQQRIARAADGHNYYTSPGGQRYRADYTTRFAGRIQNAGASEGVFPLSTGNSATSLPYVNSLIMVRDTLAGRIEHAITLTLPVTGNRSGAPSPCQSSDLWVAPATRCDTYSWLADGSDRRSADGVREGTLLRLPATFDPLAYAAGADPRSMFLRMVLTAIRDYGMYVNDSGYSINLIAEGRTAIGFDTPYHDVRPSQVPAWWASDGIFHGRGNIVYDIPWSQLQVVQPHARRDWAGAGR